MLPVSGSGSFGSHPKGSATETEKGLAKARQPQKWVQACQSVLPSPDRVLQATSWERWTQDCLDRAP